MAVVGGRRQGRLKADGSDGKASPTADVNEEEMERVEIRVIASSTDQCSKRSRGSGVTNATNTRIFMRINSRSADRLPLRCNGEDRSRLVGDQGYALGTKNCSFKGGR